MHKSWVVSAICGCRIVRRNKSFRAPAATFNLPGWIVSQGGLRGRFAGRNVSQWLVVGRCGFRVDGAGLRVAVKCEPVWIGHLDQLN